MLFASGFAWLILGVLVPGAFSDSTYLVQLAKGAAWIAPLASLLLLLVFVSWVVIQTHTLRKWERGDAPQCMRCGGLLEGRVGPFSPYSKCLACGKTQ